jgi:hypothetical protein
VSVGKARFGGTRASKVGFPAVPAAKTMVAVIGKFGGAETIGALEAARLRMSNEAPTIEQRRAAPPRLSRSK